MALFPTRTPKSAPDKDAEREAAQQRVLMQEIDDALREDEARRLFRRYALPVGSAVAAGLVALAGYLWYNAHVEAVAGERGEAFTMALDQVEAGQLDAGKAKLAAMGDAGPGYRAAGTLMQADIAAQQGKAAEAARLFAAVAADQAAPKAYRDLAIVRSVAAGFDTLPAQQVVDRLRPLAAPGNPWFGSAGELLGAAYLKQGRSDLAGPLYAAIARDKQVPETIRRRVRQLAAQLGVDLVDDAEATAKLGG